MYMTGEMSRHVHRLDIASTQFDEVSGCRLSTWREPPRWITPNTSCSVGDSMRRGLWRCGGRLAGAGLHEGSRGLRRVRMRKRHRAALSAQTVLARLFAPRFRHGCVVSGVLIIAPMGAMLHSCVI